MNSIENYWFEKNLVVPYKDANGKSIKQVWFTRADVRRIANKAQKEAIEAITPRDYVMVLVPDEKAPDQPDWAEVKRQAEEATGLKAGGPALSILIREVRRWMAHRGARIELNPKKLTVDCQHVDVIDLIARNYIVDRSMAREIAAHSLSCGD